MLVDGMGGRRRFPSLSTSKLSAFGAVLVILVASWPTVAGQVPVNIPPTLSLETPEPSPGAGPYGLDLAVSWGEAFDVDSATIRYDVHYGFSASTLDLVGCADILETTCLLAGLPYESTIFWRVDAKDEESISTGDIWDFFTKRAPETPHSPSPPDDSAAVDRPVVLTWLGADPDGFGLTFDVRMREGGNEWVTVCRTVAYSCDPGTLRPVEDYAWQVLADDSYQVTAGPIWNFSTAANRPPSLVSGSVAPLSDDIVRGENITFNWQATDLDGDQVYGTVQIAHNGSYYDGCTGIDGQCKIDYLIPNEYEYRLALSDSFNDTISSHFDFVLSTNSVPEINLTYPSNSAYNIPLSSTATFNSFDADDDSLQLEVYLGTPTENMTTLCSGQIVSCEFENLAYGTEYWWQVMADDGLNSTLSPVHVFRTINGTLPSVPLILSPEQDEIALENAVDLVWEELDESVSNVTVLFSNVGPASLSPLQECSGSVQTACSLSDLRLGSRYYWSLEVANDVGVSRSPVYQFWTPMPEFPEQSIDPRPSSRSTAYPNEVAWRSPNELQNQTYTVYFEANDATPDVVLRNCEEVGTWECQLPSLESGTQYFWQVETSSNGLTNRSQIWTFTTPWVDVGDESLNQSFSSAIEIEYLPRDPQVHSQVAWSPTSENVTLVSDGRDDGHEEYYWDFSRPISSDENWYVSANISVNDFGENQKARILTLAPLGFVIAGDVVTWVEGRSNLTGMTFHLCLGEMLTQGRQDPTNPLYCSPGIHFSELEKTIEVGISFSYDSRELSMVVSTEQEMAIESVNHRDYSQETYISFREISHGSLGQGYRPLTDYRAMDIEIDDVRISWEDPNHSIAHHSIAPSNSEMVHEGEVLYSWLQVGASRYDVQVQDAHGTWMACENVNSACQLPLQEAGANLTVSLINNGSGSIEWVGELFVRNLTAGPQLESFSYAVNGTRIEMNAWAVHPAEENFHYVYGIRYDNEQGGNVCVTKARSCVFHALDPASEYSLQVELVTAADSVFGDRIDFVGPEAASVSYFQGLLKKKGTLGVPEYMGSWFLETAPISLTQQEAIIEFTATSLGTESSLVGLGFGEFNIGIYVQDARIGDIATLTFDASALNLITGSSQDECNVDLNIRFSVTGTGGYVNKIQASIGDQLVDINNAELLLSGHLARMNEERQFDLRLNSCTDDKYSATLTAPRKITGVEASTDGGSVNVDLLSRSIRKTVSFTMEDIGGPVEHWKLHGQIPIDWVAGGNIATAEANLQFTGQLVTVTGSFKSDLNGKLKDIDLTAFASQYNPLNLDVTSVNPQGYQLKIDASLYGLVSLTDLNARNYGEKFYIKGNFKDVNAASLDVLATGSFDDQYFKLDAYASSLAGWLEVKYDSYDEYRYLRIKQPGDLRVDLVASENQKVVLDVYISNVPNKIVIDVLHDKATGKLVRLSGNIDIGGEGSFVDLRLGLKYGYPFDAEISKVKNLEFLLKPKRFSMVGTFHDGEGSIQMYGHFGKAGNPLVIDAWGAEGIYHVSSIEFNTWDAFIGKRVELYLGLGQSSAHPAANVLIYKNLYDGYPFSLGASARIQYSRLGYVHNVKVNGGSWDDYYLNSPLVFNTIGSELYVKIPWLK